MSSPTPAELRAFRFLNLTAAEGPTNGSGAEHAEQDFSRAPVVPYGLNAMKSARAFAHASLQNTLITVWLGDPTVAELEILGRELDLLAKRHVKGIHLLNVITPSTGMPDSPARELLKRQFEAMRGRLLSAAIVIEHRGIVATLSRTVISTLMTLSKKPFELNIQSDRAHAADWLSTSEGVPPPRRLLEIATSLEAKLSPAIF
jgi:hypothetical protein